MTLSINIYRYNPEKDKFPYMQSIEFEKPKRDIMVLELLNQLKEKDPTISYRRSCREGVCGSDGMNINGKNGLACITPLSSVIKKNKLDLRPLPGLPVVRDLVVDMNEFYAQYEKIKPFLQNDTPVDIGERLQSPEDRDKLIKEETIKLIPNVNKKGLRGGVIYHDGQFDDTRMAISIALTANDQNACLINYCEVIGLIKKDNLSHNY